MEANGHKLAIIGVATLRLSVEKAKLLFLNMPLVATLYTLIRIMHLNMQSLNVQLAAAAAMTIAVHVLVSAAKVAIWRHWRNFQWGDRSP
ncbi:MAG: hypothetical protein HUJ51_05070 [Eggerthellaceae bacterium]|nr:hypothetical protein [Eggerthellaceae bacterium]